MAFNYLLDIWRQWLNRTNRFSELEDHAKMLLRRFVNNQISDEDFAKEFDNVGRNFIELTTINGQRCIDEDTPLWLNMLLGLHFVDWYQFQTIKWYFEAHPEDLKGKSKEHYERLVEQEIDFRFKETCKTILRKLNQMGRKY